MYHYYFLKGPAFGIDQTASGNLLQCFSHATQRRNGSGYIRAAYSHTPRVQVYPSVQFCVTCTAIIPLPLLSPPGSRWLPNLRWVILPKQLQGLWGDKRVSEGMHPLHPRQLPLSCPIHKDRGETDTSVDQGAVLTQETQGFLGRVCVGGGGLERHYWCIEELTTSY